MSLSIADQHPYASLEYRCPTCNKLVVKGLLLKGYVEFKCVRCRGLFGFRGPADGENKNQYLIVSNVSGTIENCSTSMTHQLGYAWEDIVGKKVSTLYVDETCSTTDRILAERVSAFRYLRFDTKHKKKDKSTAEVVVTLRTLSIGGQSRIVRLAYSKPSVPWELSERATFKMVNHSDFDGELDIEGNIVYADRRACARSGYLPEELIGKSWWDFVPLEEVPRRQANMHDLFASGSSYRTLDSRVRIKDGSIVEYEAFATPSYDDFGNLVGYKTTNWLKES